MAEARALSGQTGRPSGGPVRAFKCEEETTNRMDELEARIEALERAVTDGDHDLSELATEGETRERLAAVETETADLADRVAELEAATQALRGYVGNVRAVNRDIEQRADAALTKAESVESAIVDDRPGDPPGHGRPADRSETPPGSDDSTGPETNRSSPGSHGTATPEQQAEPTRQRADRSTTTDGQTTTTDGQTATTDSAGNGHSSNNHRGQCAACGRPTGAGSDSHTFERAPTSGTERDDRGAGVDDTAASTVRGNGTSASAAGVGRTRDDRGDDPLDGVFETEEPESREDGAFDRIREML